MTLTYPELIAIGGVLAAYGKFPHLTEAIDRELVEARADTTTTDDSPSNNSSEMLG